MILGLWTWHGDESCCISLVIGACISYFGGFVRILMPQQIAMSYPLKETTKKEAALQKRSLLFGLALLFLLLRGYLLPTVLRGLASDTVHLSDLVAKCTSTIHAALVAPCALLYLTKRMSFKHWHRSLSFTQGYLIANSIMDVYDFGLTKETILFLVHHVVFFLILAFFANRKRSYAGLIGQGMLAEFTLPFLYYTWYLLKTGGQQWPSFLPAAIIAYVGWLILRVGNFTYILQKLLKKDPRPEVLLFVPLVSYNYYMFYRLTTIAVANFF